MNEMNTILPRWLVTKYRTVQSFTFWKVSANLYNFRGPVYKGFPSHEWNETHPLMMTASQLYKCVKFSLSENWVLNYATLGFQFIRGFFSHEWNDTHP